MGGAKGRRLAAHKTDPHAFAARRRLAANAALRPFLNRGWWRRHHHLGWVGPLFWPYAYGNFFYYTLWPYGYGYIDPFWAYGYNDIYAGIFWPHSYEGYVRGRRAPSRMAALTRGVRDACAEEAAEVIGWPIDQIQQVVEPNERQRALLDNLGNAVVAASDAIKAQCPTDVAFTPTGRLAAMQQRLEGMVRAVNIIGPPLKAFYGALSDEQKARFDAMGAPGDAGGAEREADAASANPQAACGGTVMAWPAERIERIVQPTDAQRPKLEALQGAAARATDIVKASCPNAEPRTPPARLEAVGKRLAALLDAVETVRPPLQDFYDALSDDQKARFNTLGRELFAGR